MTSTIDQQYNRDCLLVVSNSTGNGIDLSELRIKFTILNMDEESPNTANIRVYNLSEDTVKKITGKVPVEFTSVTLKAGYKNGSSGIIFSGTIKQFRKGRENNIDSYLDILAADGDEIYNFSICNTSLPKEQTSIENRLKVISNATGLPVKQVEQTSFGGVLPRGKVMWGMNRALMRDIASTIQSTWSINNGTIQVIGFQQYLPNEAVILNAQSGLIGVPEQTDQGIRIRCLLNPRIAIGGRIRINNSDINQTLQQNQFKLAQGQQTYNQWTGLQNLADVSTDGDYRVYVCEYHGDTRGQDWYCDIIGLAIDSSSEKVEAKQ